MTSAENHLIERLPRTERARLLAICEPVQLASSEVLCEYHQPVRFVYFPTRAFISLVTEVSGHPGIEVGMVGREGMVGAQLALGVATSPLRALVQGAGSAWRIEPAAFRLALSQSDALRDGLDCYISVLMAQLAASSACIRFHRIGPRLARWLLMSQDRAHHDRFHLTHEFLAYLLGVRRVSITAAAGELQRNGLIKYHRGDIAVLNRAGLEAVACSCYASDKDAYSSMID